MIAVATVVVVVVLSLIVTRIATVVLGLTGLSTQSARFQARSAFSGVGFTTTEAESIVNHPVRRRVVMILMLVGSAGIVAAVATLVVSLSTADGGTDRLARIGILAGALVALLLATRIPIVDRGLTRAIERLLARHARLEVRDYASLLDLEHDYSVAEFHVAERSWLAGRTLGELALRAEGVAPLGLRRDGGTYIGVPADETVVQPGDSLVLYGARPRLAELERRPRGPDGDVSRTEAVRAHRGRMGAEAAADARTGGGTG